MTRKKLENILQKHVLNSLHGNYLIKDRYIIKMPVKDILVGYYFEKSSSENCLYVWWFSQPLYIPDDILHLTFGNRISQINGNELWDFSTSKLESTINLLLPELKKQSRQLESLEEPIDFYKFHLEKRRKNIRIYEATTYTACWIGLQNMYDEIENCLNFIDNNLEISIPWIKQIWDNLELLQSQKNHLDILALLKSYKQSIIAKLKLD